MTVQKMLFVIADIGGYTRFMRANTTTLAHAQLTIASLLNAIIQGASSLKVAKVEGDAVFFYSQATSAEPLEKVLGKIRSAFGLAQGRMTGTRTCHCEACCQMEDLTLKFVAHRGEAMFQKINRFRELAGVDVILVHRMLKNDVPLREYVLVSDSARALVGSELASQFLPLEHDFEGLGRTSTHYVESSLLPINAPPVTPASLWGKFVAKVWLELRTVPYWLRFRRAPPRGMNQGPV
jgi:hypothetical protein